MEVIKIEMLNLTRIKEFELLKLQCENYVPMNVFRDLSNDI